MQKKTLLIVTISIGILLLIGLTLAFLLKKEPEERGKNIDLYDSTLTIENIKEYPLKTVNKELSAGIFGATIAQSTYDKSRHYTGVIRSGTYVSEVTDGISTRSFIFDIETERKSWSIQVLMQDENTIALNGVRASCLPEDQLLYGAFDCKASRFEDAEIKDPLANEIPYRTNYYLIGGSTNSSGSLDIDVRIMVNYSDNTKSIFAKHQSEVIEWIRSKNVQPEDYTITWRDFSGSVILIQ